MRWESRVSYVNYENRIFFRRKPACVLDFGCGLFLVITHDDNLLGHVRCRARIIFFALFAPIRSSER